MRLMVCIVAVVSYWSAQSYAYTANLDSIYSHCALSRDFDPTQEAATVVALIGLLIA